MAKGMSLVSTAHPSKDISAGNSVAVGVFKVLFAL